MAMAIDSPAWSRSASVPLPPTPSSSVATILALLSRRIARLPLKRTACARRPPLDVVWEGGAPKPSDPARSSRAPITILPRRLRHGWFSSRQCPAPTPCRTNSMIPIARPDDHHPFPSRFCDPSGDAPVKEGSSHDVTTKTKQLARLTLRASPFFASGPIAMPLKSGSAASRPCPSPACPP